MFIRFESVFKRFKNCRFKGTSGFVDHGSVQLLCCLNCHVCQDLEMNDDEPNGGRAAKERGNSRNSLSSALTHWRISISRRRGTSGRQRSSCLALGSRVFYDRASLPSAFPPLFSHDRGFQRTMLQVKVQNMVLQHSSSNVLNIVLRYTS